MHTKRHLLLAEDDDELRWALAALFNESGWTVQEVADGAAFLEAINTTFLEERAPPPDVILTDIRMPGFNGLNIIEGMRELGLNTPAVIMSAFGDDETRARVNTMAHTFFFAKPLDFARLESTLRRMM